MYPRIPLYIYLRSGRLHFVKKKEKLLYPSALREQKRGERVVFTGDNEGNIREGEYGRNVIDF
jgi:hypothetical protein